ncbi:MAG TPA: hypothetical protein VJA23_01145 [Candidatus Nanoarchaeia archaeon]|nr:hypothetical protein [Candidatus Nanoarchaeia archaeon]
MTYRVVPLKKAPDLQLEDTFGVRTGGSMEDALGNLEKAIKSHLVRQAPGKSVIYVYPVSQKSYEAALTDNFQYTSLPEVLIKDRRGRERF